MSREEPLRQDDTSTAPLAIMSRGALRTSSLAIMSRGEPLRQDPLTRIRLSMTTQGPIIIITIITIVIIYCIV